MAPSVAQLAPEAVDPAGAAKQNIKVQEIKSDNVCIAFTFLPFCSILFWWQAPSYPFYLPCFDVNEKFVPLELFGMFTFYFTVRARFWTEPYHSSSDHVDAGTRADPKKPHLLNPNVTTNNISPYLGTEISGVQISELTKEGLDELALFAAERKVLIFRDQDFKDIGPDRQIEIAKSVLSMHFYLSKSRLTVLLGTLVRYKDILLLATSRVIQNFTLVGLFCAKHVYGVCIPPLQSIVTLPIILSKNILAVTEQAMSAGIRMFHTKSNLRALHSSSSSIRSVISQLALWVTYSSHASLKLVEVTPSSFLRSRLITDCLPSFRNVLKVYAHYTLLFIKPSSRESVMVPFAENL